MEERLRLGYAHVRPIEDDLYAEQTAPTTMSTSSVTDDATLNSISDIHW